MNRSSFVSKLFTPVITLLVLAYFGYQIYGYVSDPFSTTLAYTYQVEDTVDISGYVVRQEQVLTGDAGGLMRLRKNEGERIGTGGAVATVYADQASLDRQNEIETLNNRIEQLEYAQESMLGAEVTLKLDSQIARSLLDYRTVVAAGRLDAAESHLKRRVSLAETLPQSLESLTPNYLTFGKEEMASTSIFSPDRWCERCLARQMQFKMPIWVCFWI